MGKTLGEYLAMIAAAILFFAIVAVLVTLQGARLKKFAAAKGLTYRPDGKLPIAIPRVVYGERHILQTSTWLLGPWNGFEVFACDIRVAPKRNDSDHRWLLFVAVHAELQGTSGLDTETWKPWPLKGWTFLVPRKAESCGITIPAVTELWDDLTAAARNANPKVEAG